MSRRSEVLAVVFRTHPAWASKHQRDHYRTQSLPESTSSTTAPAGAGGEPPDVTRRQAPLRCSPIFDPRAETPGARPRRPEAPWLVAVVGVIIVVMLALTVGAVIEGLAVLVWAVGR